jgi:hypothetical protein
LISIFYFSDCIAGFYHVPVVGRWEEDRREGGRHEWRDERRFKIKRKCKQRDNIGKSERK